MRKTGVTTLVACALMIGIGSLGARAQDSLPSGWSAGPVVGNLGDRATISVPDGYLFLDVVATRKFLQDNENIPSGRELGTIVKPLEGDDYWFAVFTYSDTGHIDDSDRDKLDAAAMLKSMREGEKQDNAERQKRGWAPLTVEGWQHEPFYDVGTNNLTWATRLRSGEGIVINHSVRLLGRTGMMSAQLVASPDAVETSTMEFNEALRGYTFKDGQRYAQFRQGDKLAGYGLTALIAGGAGAAAVKTGAFKKLWKLLVVVVIGIVGAIKKLWSAISRPRESGRPVPRVPEPGALRPGR
jgi:uncharacterized membrane-anchored protein